MDITDSPVPATLPAPPPPALAAQIVHRRNEPAPPRPEADGATTPRTPRRASETASRVRAHGPSRQGAHDPAHDRARGPDLPRDRAVLIHLARLRLLLMPQLGRLAFAGRDRSRVSRRVRTLERGGWVTTWEERAVIGGRPRYVLPTREGLRWALRRLEEETRTSPYARLVETMLRRDGRVPLPLLPGSAPAFLPHLRQTNELVVALQSQPGLGVCWASSWHRPLPNRAFALALPQPDAVIVSMTADETYRLAFLELDRGHESLRHFARTKADHYRALVQRPALLRELTGFDTFEVWVAVDAGERTARRIEDLARVARECFTERLFRFRSLETGHSWTV